MNLENDGFEVPLHRSLTEPILVAGVPRAIAILNFTFCAMMFFGLHSFWVVAVGVLVHFVFAYFTQKDPRWFEILRGHLKEGDRYVP